MELLKTLTAKDIREDQVLKNYLVLCGSRYMANRYPDIIQVNENTDYDFYCVDNDVVYSRLIELGIRPARDTRYSFDDLAVHIFAGSNFQVILRKNVYVYSKVMANIDPEFYRDYLWKSGPNKPLREQIQRIMNQMFKIAVED